MTDRTWRYFAAVVLILAAALTAMWAMPAEACTPRPAEGYHCPDELPAQYARTCADGCHIVHPDAFDAAQKQIALIPRLREKLGDLRLIVEKVRLQRDEMTASAVELGDELDLKLDDLILAQKDLADAPSWSTVVVWAVLGVASGYAACEVVDWMEGWR